MRIVLRPAELPRYPLASCQLHGDWHWWRLALRPDANGNRFVQRLDDPDDIREYTVEFGDYPGVVVNPPVLRLLTVHQLETWGDGRAMLTDERAEVQTVWCGPPPGPVQGPTRGWEMLPGNTCRPGSYETKDVTEERGQRMAYDVGWRDAYEQRWHSGQPLLGWPLATILVPEQQSPAAAFIGPILTEIREDLMRAAYRVGFAVPVIPPALPPGSRYGRRTDPRRAPVAPRPEQAVLDDIDELVNEQLAPGPVDDYQVNRYPKCAECGHDWHGLDCEGEGCCCLTTDWLKPPGGSR